MSASHGKSDTPNGTGEWRHRRATLSAFLTRHVRAVETTAVRPPMSPTHHRMLSDSTITEEAKSPNSFHDALSAMASPLPYGPSSAALSLNDKFTKDGNLRREESPSNDTTRPSWWEKIVAYYDLWYHRLRVRWVWFVAFLLVSIVCCSIAIGWSFRLRTFNIADPDSVNNAIVSATASLHLSVCALT